MGKNNRFEVAECVAKRIKELEDFKARSGYAKKIAIIDVCDELSIFDWWKDYLSLSQLKQMKKFLDLAEKLGYNGYVCFKVGAKYCSNGMWAHKEETTTGYSPDGECLYRSFTPEYTAFDRKFEDGSWLHTKLGDRCDISLKELLATY